MTSNDLNVFNSTWQHSTGLKLKKADKYKWVKILKNFCVFLTNPLQKSETHLFKHTADLSMQMHLISHSHNQVFLVN